MNYSGRVLAQQFSGDFLKEALRHANYDMPYRGPEYYQSGEYTYKCSVAGDFSWFQGYEEIFHNTEKVYECYTILRLKPHNLSGLICAMPERSWKTPIMHIQEQSLKSRDCSWMNFFTSAPSPAVPGAHPFSL